MNIKEVKELIQDVLRSDISEFELEHAGTRVRLKRRFQSDAEPASQNPPQIADARGSSQKPVSADAPSPAFGNTLEAEESGLHIVTSPIVGIFYCAPKPDSEPFVKLGDRVRKGMILCLVEAMKLMNEIPSDVDGEIVSIYVEDGHPVEFGQKLFGVRPQSNP